MLDCGEKRLFTYLCHRRPDRQRYLMADDGGDREQPLAFLVQSGEPRVDQKTRPGQDPMMSDRIVKQEGDGETHGDYKSTTRAIQLLEELKDKPFFLAVGFAKPHSPPAAPAKLFDLYDAAKMPLPLDFAPKPSVPPGVWFMELD